MNFLFKWCIFTKLIKLSNLIILTTFVIIGCSHHSGNPSTLTAAQNADYRYALYLCEQEANAHCWSPIWASALYVNEIKEHYKQSGCMEDWTGVCLEKQGYRLIE